MSGERVPISVETGALYAEWSAPPVAGRPSLVFFHDGLGSVETWRGFPERLGRAMGLGAFAYDRSGYGRSDRQDFFPIDFIEREVSFVPQILTQAGIEDYILVGHSDGGTVALQHAANNPKGLLATVSISAHVHIEHLAEGQLLKLREGVAAGRLPDWLEQFHGDKGPHVADCWSKTWLEIFARHWDITDRLKPITCPLLAFQGEKDGYAVPEQITSIARAVPHAKTLLLDGIDHFPHLEDPERTQAVIVDFLAGVPGLQWAG